MNQEGKSLSGRSDRSRVGGEEAGDVSSVTVGSAFAKFFFQN
jgi:hypothetical protein